MAQDLVAWIEEHPLLVRWAGALSLATFAGSLVLLPVLIARLPADYFARTTPPTHGAAERHPALHALLVAGKNLLGVLLVLAGLAMLVLPGQGLLTLLAGLVLLDFPGKRALELRLARRPALQRALNWIRERAGRAAFEPPPSTPP